MKLRSFLRASLAFLAIWMALLAILFSLARALMPLLNQHRDWFENLAQRVIGQPVHIEAINVSFQGVMPALAFNNVIVLNAKTQQELFCFQQLNVSLDLLKSIWNHKWIANYISVSGASLFLQKKNDESFVLNGTPLSFSNTTNKKMVFDKFFSSELAIFKWIFSQPIIKLNKVRLIFQSEANKSLVFNLNLILSNQAKRHQLHGTAAWLKQPDSVLSFSMNLEENMDPLSSLTGLFYLKGQNVNLPFWAQKFSSKINLKQGKSDFRIWLSLKGGVPDTIQAEVNVRELGWFTSENKRIPLDSLQGQWYGKVQADKSWSVMSRQLALAYQHHAWPIQDISLNISPERQSLYLKNLDLNKLTDWLAENRVEVLEDWAKKWKSHSPSGTLKEIKILNESPFFTLSQAFLSQDSNKVFKHLFVYAKLNQFGISIPDLLTQISGLTGRIWVTPRGGQLELRTQSGELKASKIFSNAFIFTTLSGIARWEKTSSGLIVRSKDFILNTPTAKTEGDIVLMVPENLSNTQVEAKIKFEASPMDQIHTLLPVKIMNPLLRDWLTKAFVAGEAVTGIAVMRGQLNQFPYLDKSGQFIAAGEVKNLTLNYGGPAWPYVEQLSGMLRFDPIGMHFLAAQAQIFKQKINQLSAEIPLALTARASRVNIHATLQPEAESALEFIHTSPLQASLTEFNSLKAEGKIDLNLNLSIPLLLLKEINKLKVRGQIKWMNNALFMPSWKINLTHLNGNLNFTENKFSSSLITASFLNQPIKAKITSPLIQGVQMTNIHIEGAVDSRDPISHFDLPLENYVKGKTAYQANLTLSHQPAWGKLNFYSDLSGIALNLPSIFYKSEKLKAPLSANLIFTPDRIQTDFQYDKKLSGIFSWTLTPGIKKWTKGTLQLGEKKAQLSSQNGLTILGRLPQFDFNQWKNFLEKNSHRIESKFPFSYKNSLNTVDLNIDHTYAFEQTIKNLHLQIKRHPHAWKINLNSTPILGSINVPDETDQKPIVLQFQHLYLSNFSNTEKAIKPRDLPLLALKINDLRYGLRQLGNLDLKISALKEDGRDLSLILESPGIKLKTEGSWTEKNQANFSEFSGSTEVSDLGRSINLWRFTDKMKGGSGKINFKLHWKNSPFNVSVKTIKGTAKLDLKNGVITGLDEKTNVKLNIGKVINLLSVEKLLHLNFSDLAERGYGFNTWQGDYRLDAGIIQTENTYFASSVAEIFIRGKLNTLSETYDLRLTIVPHYTSSLPLLITLLSGPIVGAVTWAANKLIISDIEKLNGKNYLLRGSWNNPKLVKVEK